MNDRNAIRQLQKRLDAVADPAVKRWFDNYLKGAIEYRGVKTPAVAAQVRAWRDAESIDKWPVDAQLELATQLVRERKAEDKFAGIIYMQKYLLDAAPMDALLDAAEALFADDAFFDWSTTDWFCARVLGPLLIRGGRKTALRIANWKTSACLWQRRSALLPFRATLKDPAHDKLIARTVADLVVERERFIQTAIGWLLSDLSKLRPQTAARLVDKHLADLSAEVVRRHTARLPRHREYRAAKRGRG